MPGYRSTRIVRENNGKWHILQTIIFLFLLGMAVFFFLQSSFFMVNKIEVSGIHQISNEQIVSLSGLKPGLNIFRADLVQAKAKIMLNPIVKKVDITRKLPRQISILVEERKPIALVPEKGSFDVLTEDGYCLYKAKNLIELNLPIVTGIKTSNINPGQKFQGGNIATALQYINTMSANLRAAVSEINVADINDIRVYTIDGTEIRFGDNERVIDKIKLYGEVVEQNYNKKIQYIDISYKGSPVIKFVGDEGAKKPDLGKPTAETSE